MGIREIRQSGPYLYTYFPEDVRNSVETSGPPGPLVYAARAAVDKT